VHRLRVLGEPVDPGEQFPAAEQEAFTRAGDANPASHALEQPDTELALEVTNLPPQRRLRDTQSCRGAREGARLSDRDEVAEVPEVHFA
jgi:hypothetical protein